MERMVQLEHLNLCGIDIGCTNVKLAAIVNGIVSKRVFSSGDYLSRNSLIEGISDFYKSFDCNFAGLGIAFSGCTFDGHMVSSTSLPCLIGLSVTDFQHLTPNVRFVNDSNATALAGTLEFPNSNVLLGITNGTGIGCGIVINGELFTGASGLAGEIYGNPVICSDLTSVKVGRLCSGSKIFKKIETNPEESEAIVNSASEYMGSVLVSLIHTLNPNVIYLSGNGFKFPNYFEKTKEFVKKHSYPSFLENLTIVSSSFGNYAGCFGAMKFISKYLNSGIIKKSEG